MDTLNFTACKYLDFSDNYLATKKLFGDTETKVFWMRDASSDSTLPSRVQFCKLQGRLNNLEACTCRAKAMCSRYEDFEHMVSLDKID